MKNVLPSFSVLLLLFAGLPGLCQDTTLKRLLALPDDTFKVQQLASYTKTLAHKDPQGYRQLAGTILNISKHLRYDQGMATAYSFLGYRDINDGKFQSCIVNYNQAVFYYKKSNDLLGVAKIHGNLANAYDALGKTDSGVIYRLSAIEMLERSGFTGDQEELRLSLLSIQYCNVAAEYDNFLGQKDKALSYYKKAEKLARQVKDTLMLVTTLNAIGVIQAHKGQSKEAYANVKEAKKLAEGTNDNLVLTRAYENYGEVLGQLNKPEEAVPYSQLAVKYADLAGSAEDFVIATYTLAAVLKKKGDYKAQIRALEKGLEKAQETNQTNYAYDMSTELADAHFKLGNYKLAFGYLKKQTLLEDSVFKEKNNRIIAEMESKYQSEKKEKLLSQQQLKLAQNDVKLQKSIKFNLYNIGATIIALLAASIVVVHYKHKRRLHQQQLQTMEREKEVQLLHALVQGEEKERGRIARDLHDGVASLLAAVKMQLTSTTINDREKTDAGYTRAIALLDEAHHEVRKTSHNLMPEVLLKYGLDKALQRYCAAISNDTLTVEYHSVGKLRPFEEHFELAVYRIIQELLGNVIKHAKASVAQVQLSEHAGMLLVEVEDNGVGFTSAGSLTSIGLKSLEARVQALNGSISFQSGKNGLTVNLEFDITTLKRTGTSEQERVV